MAGPTRSPSLNGATGRSGQLGNSVSGEDLLRKEFKEVKYKVGKQAVLSFERLSW